jgi:UDP-N-acetylmuramate dehydrogenase
VGDVRRALAWARQQALPLAVLGGGSNLLVADRGFDGVVLRVAIMGISEPIPQPDGRVRVTVGAGHAWDAFVRTAVARGWAGLECLSGIPGSVGATPIQNVGAYGQEVAETIAAVHVVDRETGHPYVVPASACRFGYRDSAFKHEARERFVVVRVDFDLTPGGRPAVTYPELAAYLHARTRREPSLADVRSAVLALRMRKSMVITPTDENRRSAGSFFMNPIVPRAQAESLRATLLAEDPEAALPMFALAPTSPSAPERVKLPAAWLIERAGFPKGTAHGRVGLSTKHALAIVNRGGAMAAELASFAGYVRESVRASFGVTLTPEPAWWGFSELELSAVGARPAAQNT